MNSLEAYRRWVCGSLFAHFLPSGERVRPCRSVCQTVEQRCPFFLPGDRYPAYPTQYAGEPTFLCLDPNIPEIGEQLKRSSYGDGGCCYNYCGSATRGPCYNEPCLRSNGTSDVPPKPQQCDPPASAAGNSSTSSSTVYSACGSSSALTPSNILVHPPHDGQATSGSSAVVVLLVNPYHSDRHTLLVATIISLLLHYIFLLVSRNMFGLGYT